MHSDERPNPTQLLERNRVEIGRRVPEIRGFEIFKDGGKNGAEYLKMLPYLQFPSEFDGTLGPRFPLTVHLRFRGALNGLYVELPEWLAAKP